MPFDPHVGVFWVHNGVVIGRARYLGEACEHVPGMLDSPDRHVDVWEEDRTLLAAYPHLHGTEYQSVLRGRVLYSNAHKQPIVYMDRSLFSRDIKEAVAAFFKFNAPQAQWCTDPHYTTDPGDLDTLLDCD